MNSLFRWHGAARLQENGTLPIISVLR